MSLRQSVGGYKLGKDIQPRLVVVSDKSQCRHHKICLRLYNTDDFDNYLTIGDRRYNWSPHLRLLTDTSSHTICVGLNGTTNVNDGKKR